MSSNVGKKHIAHTGSGHGCVFPSAVSLLSPPAPPAPSPFPYTAQASNAKDTDPKIIVSGSHKVLVEGSTMDLDPPANQPSQSGGGDVASHAVKNIGTMTTGSWALSLRGKGICATGDMCALNVAVKQSHVSQAQVPLLEAGDFEMAKASDGDAAFVNDYYATAFPPNPAKRTMVGHPVDVATGCVVDEAVDLQLPGTLRLTWSRAYCSASRRRSGALGKGGWCHSFEQHIEVRGDGLRFWNEDGRPVDLAAPAKDAPAFHRGERLEVRRTGQGYEIRSLSDRLVRVFAPLPGGRLALREIRDSRVHRIALEHEGDTLVRIVDSVGREIRISNDDNGRVVRVEVWASPPGKEAPPSLQTWFDYAYHPEGELASHTDVLGHAEGWEYDGLHRMVRATLRNRVSFHYEYHPELGYCTRTWGDGGLHDVRLDIDALAGETRTHGTERARLYRWTKGVVHREETFDGSWAVERSYDEDGLRASTANGAGEEYEYEHDARGNLIAARDPAGNEWTWEIADDRARRYVEPGGLCTSMDYDIHGDLLSAVYPDGSSRHVQRDEHGRVTAIFGASGPRVRLAYDEHGNLVSQKTAGGATTTYEYDALGRIVASRGPDGARTFVRDLAGQIVETKRPDGTRVKASYDRLGKLATLTDEAGRTSRFEHAGTGVPARWTMPDGQVYRFRHDADERLVEVVNPRLETYRVDYDRADRITGETTFDGRRIDYRHDRAGRVVRVDHPGGEWREYRYDKLGNVIEDRGEDVQIAFERDALGRILKAVCQDIMGKATTELEYDAFGRLVADVQDGRAVRYEYDGEGRGAARTLPDGERFEYHYDAAEMFAGVSFAGGRLVVQRDERGRERRRSTDSWALETAYDGMDRVLEQRVSNLAAGLPEPPVIAARRYRYDIVGRPTAVESLRGGTTLFEHDRADRLTGIQRPRGAESFDYDPAGSLAGRGAGGAPRSPWSVARGNRLRATERGLFTNDERGRLIRTLHRRDGKDPRETPPRGDEMVLTYGWDTKDRLREVVHPDGTRVRFAYDAFGRRIRKDVLVPPPEGRGPLAAPSRRTVKYLWDAHVICEEVDSSKPEVARKRIHVHQPGTLLPLLQVEQGHTFGVVADRLGTPKELIDEAGRVAWRAEHGAFGEVLSADRDPGTAHVESPFRLLGQLADPDVDLCASYYRWLDPATGRWLSPDPMGLDGGANLFAFDGSPAMVSDPFGLCAQGPGILFGQKRAAPTFRSQGPNPKLAGKTLAEVAEMIKSGEIHPDEIPVHYFVTKDGQRVADNNRGLAVLAMAGMHPTNTVEVPNHPDFDNRLAEGTKSHPLPNQSLPITQNKDGTGHITTVNLDGSTT